MFRKILKYDFRAVGRLWWILALSLSWISLLGAFILRFMISYMTNDSAPSFYMTLLMIVGFLFLIGCFMAIAASSMLSQLLVYYRFYRNFFTDEGYLTFTLPVSRKKLLLSKTVNAFIWTTLSILLILFCFSLFLFIAPPAEYAKEFLSSFFSVFGDIISFFTEDTGAWIIVYVIEAVLIYCAYMVFSISLIHFSITMGAIVAKKYKLLAGIGIYYVANMIVSTATQIIMLFGSAIMSNIYDEFLGNASIAAKNAYVSFVMLLLLVGACALAAVMYLMTQKKLENKLNLE